MNQNIVKGTPIGNNKPKNIQWHIIKSDYPSNIYTTNHMTNSDKALILGTISLPFIITGLGIVAFIYLIRKL